MNIEEYKKELAGEKQNKYGNEWTMYNGVNYQSKKEADFAQLLDTLKSAKNEADKVVSWESQIPYKFKVNGKIRTYRLDFRVWFANGVIRNYDVKGYKKGSAYDLFKLKKELVEEQHGLVVEEV